MPSVINIVEPTLTSQAGHCYSFVSALCAASDEHSTLRLWIGRQADLTFAEKNVQLRCHFFRKIRRLQSYFLYKKLLLTPDKLFIATAGSADLMLLNWAAKSTIPPNRAYLYFHWFNTNEKKRTRLRELAQKQPNLVIFAPTESVVEVFQDAGFGQVSLIPYPVSQTQTQHFSENIPFRHLLYAGAARQDKGFSRVVDLIAYFKESDFQIPVVLQISGEHYDKYDDATRVDIQRLKAIDYSPLQFYEETLTSEAYIKIFSGAICLQLYSQEVFAGRVSGVTLDAFSAGSPTVTTADTWIARMVTRFSAGVIVEDSTPPEVWIRIQKVMEEYADYRGRACEAGHVLQEENSAKNLYQALLN
jgi:hypothetical protein